MTVSDKDWSDLLRNALLQAALEDHEAALMQTGPQIFSPRYLRQRTRMLADPFGWQKRRSRPVWRQVLRTVACFVLVCVLGFAAVLTVSPTARARFVAWVTEWTQAYTINRFRGEPTAQGEMPHYTIGDLPEGYVETERLEYESMVNVTCENAEGQRIYLDYMRMEQGNMIATYMEDMEVEEIVFNGCPGQFYTSLDVEQSNAMTWMDEATNLSFSLNLFGSEEEILHIADSIYLVK